MVRYPPSHQVHHIDLLPDQSWTAGTHPALMKSLPLDSPFPSITRQSGGGAHWLVRERLSGAGRSGSPAWRLRACLTELSLFLISSWEDDRSGSATLVWKDNKTDMDHDPNLVCVHWSLPSVAH